LASASTTNFKKNGFIRVADVKDYTHDIIKKFGVKTPNIQNIASSLSGGNLQKFIFGREILQNPRIIVAIQPTWGVDAGSAAAIRQSLIDLDVISVPSEDRCQVKETPTYMRYAFAAMDSAGSLETQATESFYYVTPAEGDWSNQQKEEWLSNFNYDTLKIISIHEVYPGHFVHHLHNRYGQELPLINRVATAYSFTEGWAHYAEQMMLETEYGNGQPRLLLTQLLEALVRNCRYMCSLRMHTEGMSLDEATRFFMENAYMAELPARREALRGTFDPGYLNYTLGKLMILKLREDFKKEQGRAYSLKGFHDRLLSFGGPAIPLLRPVLLKEPGGSAL